MAEFCLSCWNEINKTNDPKWRYVPTRDLELCEGCAQYRPVIVKERLLSRALRTVTEPRKNKR